MAGALGTSPKGGAKAGDSRKSATQNTSVGSGSRPGKVSKPIETTAPSNPHTLDRNPPKDWLK
jgi:hypothetical protein